MKQKIGFAVTKADKSKENILEQLRKCACLELHISSGTTEDWLSLCEKLLEKDSVLVLDNINSLGKNKREIAKKLRWLRDNDIKVEILSLPATYVSTINVTDILYEVYENEAQNERDNVALGQRTGIQNAKENNIKLGRPLTDYPLNWDENFVKWKAGDITAKDLSGVKKGTFYNLVKRYEKMLKNDKSYSVAN